MIDKENRNKDDQHVAWVYGDPEGALISKDQKYVVIAGHGINIWYLDADRPNKGMELLNGPDNVMRTTGLHQDISADESWDYFRFVSHDEYNRTRVFRMNAYSLSVEKVD